VTIALPASMPSSLSLTRAASAEGQDDQSGAHLSEGTSAHQPALAAR